MAAPDLSDSNDLQPLTPDEAPALREVLPGTLPRWRSETLLAGAREVLIEHLDGVYRLRLTAAGKLILTK